jgi:hypothetical protein
MNLYIETDSNGNTINHPAYEDNLIEAFGEIPPHWETFVRVAKPIIGVYQKFNKPDHDPRPAKVQLNLPEANMNIATPASQMINFEPKPGMFIFSNAWLPHSFTRHGNKKPIRFVHFNVAVQFNQTVTVTTEPKVEVV